MTSQDAHRMAKSEVGRDPRHRQAQEQNAKEPEMSEASHEDFTSQGPRQPGSDRAFGVTIGVALWLIAANRAWRASPSWWAFAILGTLFILFAWLAPKRLAPLNYLWFRFGLLLHKVVSPVVFGIIFFGIVTPIGLLMRWRGHRPLAPGVDRLANSYWTSRTDPPQSASRMTKQY